MFLLLQCLHLGAPGVADLLRERDAASSGAGDARGTDLRSAPGRRTYLGGAVTALMVDPGYGKEQSMLE